MRRSHIFPAESSFELTEWPRFPILNQAFSEFDNEEDRSLIIRRNGEVLESEGTEIKAGDEIIILPKVPVKNLQLAATIFEIIFQIALASATVAAL